jgi:hypothetical protein
MKKIIKNAYNYYFDLKSYKTKRRIVVIESDDWGSYRTKNNQFKKHLNRINPDIEKDPYSQLDTIASAEDLMALFEVLNSVKDKNGHPACITANTCMANPDFDKIRKSDFEKYYYLPFYDTILETGGKKLWELWETGMKQGFLTPQLHGREHLHSLQWLEELKAGNEHLLRAFELKSFGIPYDPLLTKRRKNLQAALDHYGLKDEQEFQKNWLKDSAELFENTFGYKSLTFIATAYIWHSKFDTTIKSLGIKAYQGIKLQYQPVKTGYKKRPHYIGQPKNDLTYLIRNVFFEPALNTKKNWVNETLLGVKKAFDKDQPAIIGSHRINFIGALEENNRINNLKLLKEVLTEIIKKYPEVEFVNSAELSKIINNDTP